MIREHPEWLLLDADGSKHKITYWNAFYLCPAVPEVRKNAADFVTKFIRDWGYDGLKLDGQYMNAAPPCYNPAHKHADPNESVEQTPLFFKGDLRRGHRGQEGRGRSSSAPAARRIPSSLCRTRTWLWHRTRMIPGRFAPREKTLKALMGDRIAYFGDHVELSDERQDFASSVGIGAVVGYRVYVAGGFGSARAATGQRRSDLTPEREKIWSKWLEIYKEKMLSKGEYLGGLYDIGFDAPETHAIRKDKKMYYSFFAKTFGGKVELRGLEKRKYKVRDYVNGVDLSTVTGPVAAVDVNFLKHCCLKPRRSNLLYKLDVSRVFRET
jgi:alpha-galactosidase